MKVECISDKNSIKFQPILSIFCTFKREVDQPRFTSPETRTQPTSTSLDKSR